MAKVATSFYGVRIEEGSEQSACRVDIITIRDPRGGYRHPAESTWRREAGRQPPIQVCSENWRGLAAEMRNAGKVMKCLPVELRTGTLGDHCAQWLCFGMQPDFETDFRNVENLCGANYCEFRNFVTPTFVRCRSFYTAIITAFFISFISLLPSI